MCCSNESCVTIITKIHIVPLSITPFSLIKFTNFQNISYTLNTKTDCYYPWNCLNNSTNVIVCVNACEEGGMSVYPKSQCSQRPLSQGAFLSTPSVGANKEPHPKELFCLPQVLWLTKSLIPMSFSVYPKCWG